MKPIRIEASELRGLEGLERQIKPTVPTQGAKFDKILQTTKGEPNKETLLGGGIQYLENVVVEWSQTRKEFSKAIDGVSPKYQRYLNLQLAVSDLHLQSEVISKVGEAFSSTIRKVQQMGSN